MRAFPIIAALLLCGSAAAEQVRPALALTGRVVDDAALIDPATRVMLTARLARLERENGAQLVIATTRSLDGAPIETYSLNLARAWRIGSKARNDGLLLLVAPNERKVRIEVGTGLEKMLPDDLSARIIQRYIIPHFRAGDMQAGILAGTGAILRAIDQRVEARRAA